MKIKSDIVIIIILSSLISCHQFAISKYHVGRQFDFKKKDEYRNYFYRQNLFDCQHILYLDSSSYLSFMRDKIQQDSTVVYIGSYLNDSICINKTDFLSKNTSCKGRIDEEISRNMKTINFPDSMQSRVKNISSYTLKYLHDDSPFRMAEQEKKVKVFMAYSYSFGTYYDDVFRKVMVSQKTNAPTADVFIISMDPFYHLK